MTRSLVAVNAQGRVTLPADVRRRLHLTAGDQLEVAVADDRITLRPARVLVAEDAWAYTAESLSTIRRALDDIREGRVYQASESDLLAGRYPRRDGKRRARGPR
ncbi:MAG: AbrB/MazE/SpoVT family DNA-binding domain-containing protein [Candidatus Limnocylindria bacterium]|nr:AbrB/MazE/SpoVT family DNA-binding domain-containing protein [Candidatus Limnocylindria bacterium]